MMTSGDTLITVGSGENMSEAAMNEADLSPDLFQSSLTSSSHLITIII